MDSVEAHPRTGNPRKVSFGLTSQAPHSGWRQFGATGLNPEVVGLDLGSRPTLRADVERGAGFD